MFEDGGELLEVVEPYIRAATDGGEPLLVASRRDRVDGLRSVFGGLPDARFVDTEDWNPNPGTRLRAMHDLVTDALDAGAKRVWVCSEPPLAGRSPAAVREWERFESVLNAILAPFPVTILCLYDKAHLDPTVIETARRTHPVLHEDGLRAPSSTFQGPETFLREWRHQLEPPPPSAALLAAFPDLATVRRFVREHATGVGVALERAMELCVAVSEIMTNAFVHGGGPTALWTWTDDGQFICQIDDHGEGIADPIAGYRPPGIASNGRGLWISRQLVDLLQVESHPKGTSVRLHVEVDENH